MLLSSLSVGQIIYRPGSFLQIPYLVIDRLEDCEDYCVVHLADLDDLHVVRNVTVFPRLWELYL